VTASTCLNTDLKI